MENVLGISQLYRYKKAGGWGIYAPSARPFNPYLYLYLGITNLWLICHRFVASITNASFLWSITY